MLSKLHQPSRWGCSQPSTTQHTSLSTPNRSSLVCRAQSDGHSALSRVFAAATAASVALSSLFGPAVYSPQADALTASQYEQQVQRLHHHKHPLSNLPSSDEAEALKLLLYKDMFTPEAWEGMVHLQQYAQYVEQLAAAGVEDSSSCESCTANRMMLEKVRRWGLGCAGAREVVGCRCVCPTSAAQQAHDDGCYGAEPTL